MANTWGESGTTWSQGDWGQQNVTTIYPSGLLSTSNLGTVTAFNEIGWGSDAWGIENWGASGLTISVTGYSIAASLGTLDYAGSIEGWGRDEWGYGNWGQNITTVPLTTSFEMSVGLGLEGWGRSTWGNDAWGEQSTVTIEIGEPLTGLEITGSLGTPTLNYDFIFTLSDSLLLTASRGVLSINNGADHTQGLGGIAATMSLGTLEVADVVFGPSSFLATMSVDDVTVGELQLVTLTGIGGTMSQGSLGSIPDMARGLTGIAITGSLGSTTVTDMQIGLSGIEMTGALGSGGVAPLHYKDVDITGNTSYTYVEHTA